MRSFDRRGRRAGTAASRGADERALAAADDGSDERPRGRAANRLLGGLLIPASPERHAMAHVG